MKKTVKRIAIALFAILVALQFVPVEKTNPPVHGQLTAPSEIQGLLHRACYDCHSNETSWPWYSHVAPASLLIANDVQKGRKEVNFSTWEQYDERRRARKLKEIATQVEKGDMPLFYYLPLHPDAKLTAAERELIVKWAKQS